MTIRTMIVDDEAICRDRLRDFCQQEQDVDLLAECRNGDDAVEKIKALKPDLVFLDIHMPRLGGFEVITRVGEDNMPQVIFTTAYATYALDAFEIDAADYLLKPFDGHRFRQALQKIRNRLTVRDSTSIRAEMAGEIRNVLREIQSNEGRPDRIVAEKGGRLVVLNIDDIDYVEAQRNYVSLHVNSDSYLLRCSMKRIERLLNPRRFLRIHRSVIVNTERIMELERWFHGEYQVVLDSGRRFTSGRSYRKKLLGYIHNKRDDMLTTA